MIRCNRERLVIHMFATTTNSQICQCPTLRMSRLQRNTQKHHDADVAYTKWRTGKFAD